MKITLNYTEKEVNLINTLLHEANVPEVNYDEFKEQDIIKKWVHAKINKEFIEIEFSHEFLTDVVDLIKPVVHYTRKVIDIIELKFKDILSKYGD